jgi:uncharacterized protein (DUF433 family)
VSEVKNIIAAFGPDHVVELTGLSKGQLAYWDKTGFFSPEFGSEDRRDPFSRVYSFRDVVGLRTLAILRKLHRISLQRLRRFAERLSQYDKELWSGLRLRVLNRDVYLLDSESGIAENADGQTAPIILMSDIISDISEKSRSLKKRMADQYGRIERHKFTMRNAPVIAGTRIPVATIKRFQAAGYSVADILKEYPTLTKRDVHAALKYKEKLAAHS